MIANKPERAALIVAQLLALDKEFGITVPGGANGRGLSRQIGHDPRWQAKITKGLRVTFAQVYAASGDKGRSVFGERRIIDRKWTMIELTANRRSVLVINLCGEEIQLFRYIPGAWESWFGVDNGGDAFPYEMLFFPRPGSEELQALLDSPDAQLPPAKLGPVEGDQLRNPSGRRRRRGSSVDIDAKFPPLR